MCSKFDYDKNMLEMLVRLEFKANQEAGKLDGLQAAFEQERRLTERVQSELTRITNEAKGLRQSLQLLNDTLGNITGDPFKKLMMDASDAPTYFFMRNPTSIDSVSRIVFRDRNLSEPSWYNAATGELTIGRAGLYHVMFTFITSSDTVSPYCNLYLNSVEVIHNRGKGVHQSTTAGMYVMLNKGDYLDIRCYLWSNIHQGRGTMFTGALIHPAV